MTIVDIYKADTDQLITSLGIGDFIIGRGPLLKCEDKRISRNHALIQISSREVSISSTHMNPCFFKDATSTTVTILPKNENHRMHDGDKFGLLPDAEYWFQIRVHEKEDDSALTNCSTSLNLEDNKTDSTTVDLPSTSCQNSVSIKRELEDEESSNNSNNNHKKQKIDDDNEEVEENLPAIPMPIKTEIKSEPADEEPTTSSCNKNYDTNGKADTNLKIKKEVLSDEENDGEEQNEEVRKIKTESEVNNDQTINDQETSGNAKRCRDRCWYGTTCYRKNPSHCTDFSHPGDSDYESDPDDDRPPCPYGADCYRTNKQHRKDMKHPKTNFKLDTKKKKTSKKPKRVTKKAKPTAPEDEISEEDDYDYDDPFLNDGSSDDFEPTDEDSDSDSDWSGADDVDEENTRRLRKEAKNFVKKK